MTIDLDFEELTSDPSLDLFDTKRECIGCGTLFLPQQRTQVRCKRDCSREPRTGDRHKTRTGDRHTVKNRHPLSTQLTRPMIGIDGEGWGRNELGQQPLRLLTACDTKAIIARVYNKNGDPLSLEQKLEFFLSLPQDATPWLYYGNYDITQVLCGLPAEVIRELLGRAQEKERDRRYSYTYTDWNGYRLLYWPGHKFAIARAEPDPEKPGNLRSAANSRRQVFEAAGYFQKKFAVVLRTWNCLTPEERAYVEKWKEQRHKFKSMSPAILRYNKLECRGLAELMTKLRDMALKCEDTLREKGHDFQIWPRFPNEPTGAGSLGKALLTSANAPRRRPDDLRDRRPDNEYLPLLHPLFKDMIERYAWYGGRFEISATGRLQGPIYAYDLNSAYPHAMLSLPCPLHTRWRKVSSRPPRSSLYLASVQFDHLAGNLWCGLPVRAPDGSLSFPRQGRGVYWSHEIETAEHYLGATILPIPFNPDYETAQPATFFDRGNDVETAPTFFVAEKRCNCGPLELIEPVFAQRLLLAKAEGYPLKLGLNSISGKFGQRTGAAMHRNPLAFSFVTSYVRAALAKLCGQFPHKIIMLAADSIHSTEPLPLAFGNDLGQWKREKMEDLFVVMPGFHWSSNKLAELKSRGMSATVVRQQVPALEKAWREFIAKCQMEEEYCRRHGIDNRGTALKEIPAVAVNDPIFISAAMALQMEQQGIGEATALIGRWQNPCPGDGCDHQFCGRRELSFDWRGKRGRCRVRGEAVYHLPQDGNLSQWSLPFDPERLTGITGSAMKLGALPDAYYLAPDHLVEDANILDDETARRLVRGV
jgi:hypothetical protein